MGKKSVKRKTRWRTLSITESVDGNSPESAGNSTNTSNIGEAVSLNDSFRNYSSNYSYLQRKSFDSSKSFGSDNRNSFSNTNSYYHNKYNNGTLTSASSKYGHRRRPLSYQNGSSRYYSSYWDSRAGNRNSRPSTFSDKENISTKPRFNEDEYTRITTPRQDVIFKKGYLSQPKRYLSSTDTYTTSSAAASVISTEESMSATSVPSLSPEQCSSHADSMDPEQAIMYSYFDQNGVLYVGPYMPNGFDQYSGQMFMLPYACPPYISPPDIISPSLSVDMEENQSTNTTDTNENEKNEKKDEESIQETTDESKELSENCDPKPDASEDKVEDNSTDENDSKEEKKEEEKLENKKVNNDAFYNYGYQQYYPPMFFPYVYGPPFMPVFGTDYETSNECFEEEDDDELPKHKRKERDRVHSDQNSTGATTTDYSEDDSGKEEISDPQESLLPETTCTESTQPGLIPNDETENKQIIFNANVEEFVPRTVKSRFNVHVKEFLPRRYKLKENISTEETTSKREKSPDNLKPSNDSQKSKETHSISEISIDITADDKSPSSANAAIVVQKKDLTIKKQLEKPSPKPRPTLADKIKKRLATEPKQILFQQTNPPKSTIEQANKKKVLKTNAYAAPKSSLSYAQMLSKNGKQNAKVTVNNATIAAPESAKQQCNDDEKDKLNQSQNETPTTNNSMSTGNSEWTTVKPRGKRAKHFKEVPIEELSIDDVIVVEDNEPVQQTLEVSKNIIETPAEVKEEKKEPEIEPPVEVVTEESSQQVSAVKDVKKKAKRSKKTSTKKQTTSASHKKAKDVSFAEIDIKTELKDLENNDIITLTSESAADLDQDDDIYAKDVALLSARNSSDENLSLNNIHSLDSKKFLFGKSFGCNPLNLNGFDYKLKGKQILKEEEEMVLSVIKSLSTSQSKQFDNKNSDKSNCNSEEALETKQNGINETQRNNTNSIITNGFSAEHETIAPKSEHCDTSDNEAIEDSKEPPEEEVDEDTIILYMNEEYVNNKSVSNEKLELSENDSVSDLSSDESDQKLIEKSDELNENVNNKILESDCVNEIDFNNSESKSMPRDLPPVNINSDEKKESEMEVVGLCNGNTSEESEEQVSEEAIDEEQITELNSFNSVHEQLPNLETILINTNETPYSEYIYKEEENLDDNHSIEFNHNEMHSVTTSTPEPKDSQKVSTTLKDQLEEIENQLKKLGSITPRTLSKETLEDATPVSMLTNDDTETLNISKNEVEISCNGTFSPTENCDQSLSSIPMQCENIKQTIEEDCHASIENILQEPINEFVSPDNKTDQDIPTSIATSGDDAKDNIKCADMELTTTFNEIKHSVSTIEFPSTESSSNQTSRSYSDTTLRSSDNTEEHIDYPLTTAVKQWLNEVSKENTPEPIFRIPSDPKLTSIIKSSITQQKDFENIEADWISDESDDDNLNENPKNLKSNPSHVSSVSRRSKRRLVFYHTDNDSDYNSDSQNKYDDDNNTCERVAQNASDITNSDFLDYWDDEFIRNPKKWLRVSRSTSIERESILSTTSSELAPYDSVYGKSIDYNRLLANNYEFLSNNILSFNNKQNTNADIHETLIHAKNDTLLTNNNNFDNKHYDKENCLKPPEVCCILM